ncbi:hypothetical protein MAF45_04015 [Mesosutterella sp. OilRF-GAM-744-9]|uniref:Uncharacterized protein n=1 Tax=Mesosutterella porci TaxID=2915351 RepID=A0ABS9MPT1_9BURK|nr:hypothetical protein [Mesosutterella sp. oilRF-744-WT-GAM-9]MCG5030611.1 hypothetical protein [Mesosutterella sp. oilRF-744-WT-GAM-9]
MTSPLISFVSPPTALENAGTSSAKQGEEKNAAVPNTPNSMAKTSGKAGLRLDLIIILLNLEKRRKLLPRISARGGKGFLTRELWIRVKQMEI